MGYLSSCVNNSIRIKDSRDLFHEIALGNLSSAGIPINSATVKRISAVYSCVNVLAQTLASTPLKLYERDNNNDRSIALNHPVHGVISLKPNVFQDAMQFWELVVWNVALRGNFFALKQKRPDDRVVGLIPIPNDIVQVKQNKDYSIEYRINFTGGSETYSQDEIFHIMGPSENGFTGLTIIQNHAETFGLNGAAKKFSSLFFKNGAKPSGLLSFPAGFKDDEARDKSRKSWDEATGGANTGKTAILEGQAEYKQMSINNVDAQLLEILKFSRSDICSIFRVPPHMIADLDKATFSNIEQQSIDFAQYTMLPWFRRCELAINCQLLSAPIRRRTYAEFNINSLMRGDAKSRNEALQIQRRNGVINANEWRRMENMNPRKDDGGEEYIYEKNMTTGKEENESE